MTTGDNFNGDGRSFDANATCPPTQDTADVGLATCAMAVSRLGRSAIAAPLTFAASPVPATPTLTLSTASADTGEGISIAGTGWNANPIFGSAPRPATRGRRRSPSRSVTRAELRAAPSAAPGP